MSSDIFLAGSFLARSLSNFDYKTMRSERDRYSG